MSLIKHKFVKPTMDAAEAMDGGDYQSNSQAELSKAMQSLRNVSSIARSAVRNYSPSKIKATSNELKMFVDSQISIWSDMARSAEKANEILNGIAIPASTIKVPLKDKSAREEFNMFFT